MLKIYFFVKNYEKVSLSVMSHYGAIVDMVTWTLEWNWRIALLRKNLTCLLMIRAII